MKWITIETIFTCLVRMVRCVVLQETHTFRVSEKKKKITGALRIRYLSEYYKLDLHVKMYYTVCPRVKKFRNSNSLFRNKVNVDDQDNLKKDKYRIN